MIKNFPAWRPCRLALRAMRIWSHSSLVLLLLLLQSALGAWHAPTFASTARSRSHAVMGSRQVVTDIDDTIKSSGGLALGGIPLGGVDTSYARDTFYPGVFQFGLELACSGVRLPGAVPPKVAVLTARAEEFRFALEIRESDELCARFREAGESRGLRDWGVGPVLYGSVAEWVCQERKGQRKRENFRLLRSAAKRPARSRYIFIGDNGASEKDLEAAQLIVSDFPGSLKAVFLHAVAADASQPAPLAEDADIDGVPLLYYRTYPTAAVKAARLGLLSRLAALRVLHAAEEDLARLDDAACPAASRLLLLDEIAVARRDLERAPAWLLRTVRARRRRPGPGRSSSP
jgi:hypothetical protein